MISNERCKTAQTNLSSSTDLYWIDIVCNDYQQSFLLLDQTSDIVNAVLDCNRLFEDWRLLSLSLDLGKRTQPLSLLALGFRTIFVNELEQLCN